MLKHVNEKEFEIEVLNEDKLVVVDFFATWCGPCKMLAPVLEEIQGEMDNVKIVKVDIDENPNLAAQYGVSNIPTIKLFKNGDAITTKVGFAPKDSLVGMIESAHKGKSNSIL